MDLEPFYWTIWKRRIDAEALHQKDPAALASARGLLASIEAARWNHPKLDGRPWLSEDEVVERLIPLGPGVLSSVIDAMQPNTISGQDRSPYVRVIERLGGARDRGRGDPVLRQRVGDPGTRRGALRVSSRVAGR